MLRTTVREAGRTIAPSEVSSDGQARFRTRIIAGDVQGSSGYYPASVIERDGPKVFAKGTHMHLDHQSFFEFMDNPAGSIKDLAGVIDSTPVYEADNKDGAGLYADIRVFSEYAKLITEIAPHIGVSIRAAALSDEGPSPVTGEETNIITELISALSVDFVTHPGADGRIVKLLENAGPGVLPPGVTLIHESNPAIEPGQPEKRESKPMAELTEETAKGLEGAITALTTVLTAEAQARQTAAEAARQAQEAASQVNVEDVIAVATEALIASNLPAKARERVLKSVKAGGVLADEIAAEAAYLAEVAPPATNAGLHIQENGGTGATGPGYEWASEAAKPTAGMASLISRYAGKAS